MRDEKPFRIFVYSDDESKLKRCREKNTEDYAQGGELSDKELTKRIEQINRARAEYYEFYTGQKWGSKSNYDLCVNTSRFSDFERLAQAVASMI